jgi:hypothetical protein
MFLRDRKSLKTILLGFILASLLLGIAACSGDGAMPTGKVPACLKTAGFIVLASIAIGLLSNLE